VLRWIELLGNHPPRLLRVTQPNVAVGKVLRLLETITDGGGVRQNPKSARDVRPERPFAAELQIAIKWCRRRLDVVDVVEVAELIRRYMGRAADRRGRGICS
jgi:hypothetical protein